MISHDLGVVEHMSDRVAVMYLGRIVETGDWREIFERPAHPYTRALIAAIPDPLNRVPFAPAKGELPNPLNPPNGCAFSPRCPYAVDVCRHEPGPELKSHRGDHLVRCWRAEEIATRNQGAGACSRVVAAYAAFGAASSSPHRARLVELRDPHHRQIRKPRADDLQADRQARSAEAAVDRGGRVLGHVPRHGEGDVLERALPDR